MKIKQITLDRSRAKHGEFFFAKFALSDGTERKSPVFVISDDNDRDDVIICKCTGQPPKTEFDVKVQLKKETHVRTNKISTIERGQLLFKINDPLDPRDYNEIIDKIKKALKLL